MLLVQKVIQEFKEAYEKEYDKKLSDDEVELMVGRFLEFVFMLLHPPKG